MQTAHVVLVKVVYAFLLVWIFCFFFFQQRLAKKLLKNGFRWSRLDISGNIFHAPWLLLVSVRQSARQSPDLPWRHPPWPAFG